MPRYSTKTTCKHSLQSNQSTYPKAQNSYDFFECHMKNWKSVCTSVWLLIIFVLQTIRIYCETSAVPVLRKLVHQTFFKWLSTIRLEHCTTLYTGERLLLLSSLSMTSTVAT